MSEDYSLLVRTKSYVGNTDTFILGALFGIDDERWGGAIGVKLFEEKFPKDDERDLFCDIVTCGQTEYGMKEYQINNDFRDGYNTLEIFFDAYAEEELKALVPLWKKAYGGHDGSSIMISSDDGDEQFKREWHVEIISFHIKRYYNTYDISEI